VAPHDAHQRQEIEDLNTVGGHCPRCGAEYRRGFDTCADCEIPLVPGPAPEATSDFDHIPSEGDRLADSDEVQPVAVTALPWEEAWLMAGRLKADGIPARVFPDSQELPISLAQGFPPTRGSLDGIGLGRWTFEVMVPEKYADEARRIVAQYRRG
jgi:hypothetical protein